MSIELDQPVIGHRRQDGGSAPTFRPVSGGVGAGGGAGPTWSQATMSLPVEAKDSGMIRAMWAPDGGVGANGACGIPLDYKRRTSPTEKGDDSQRTGARRKNS
uniref:Uncharacterized protein n=1 Tax=Oryza sativa subsp. japonica TaxID=39947 RepID=Q84NS4_ORYSJ|nr:hypothetical protein [Oryza sativa Japonica Group]